ncbi:hypothetical protein DERF_008070 [Dermatophagoides farinae]|uniref:Uncharacterized protein n=1 Tax=Dermatophagoides farinae TaxID=6954 RepID=A0A922L6L8_DERFA|nr:hypothetical protein DERF_008070 [Dermatophagoides farinae]
MKLNALWYISFFSTTICHSNTRPIGPRQQHYRNENSVPEDFLRRAVHDVPKRLQKCIDNAGAYVEF